MNRSFLLFALGVALYFAIENANASEVQPDAPDSSECDPVYDLPPADMTQNLQAFLALIRRSEHSPLSSDESRYHIYYGGSSFSNLADHPVLTGEKAPVRLPDRLCDGAGISVPCYSTAAGAYQITKPTWKNIRLDRNDGFGYLPDFSPASQDAAAVRLLTEIGAIPYIESGDLATATQLASSKWASLPGSLAGQAKHTFDDVAHWFSDFGGQTV